MPKRIPIIKDIAVVAEIEAGRYNPTGEALGAAPLSAMFVMLPFERDAMLGRLQASIYRLMTKAYETHEKNSYILYFY